MMKSVLALLVLFVVFIDSPAQPRWQWVKTAQGPSFDEAHALDMGPDGDLHFIGTYYDSIQFDSNTLQLTPYYDIFTARYSSSGKLRDYDGYGGIDLDDANSIAVDHNGNYYVCGYFSESALVGGQVINGVGDGFSVDIFLAKFDPYGVLLWTNVFGSPVDDDDLSYVAVDSLGNVYLAGGFGGTGEFGTKSVISHGKLDIFVTKISAAGDVIWVKSFGGTDNDYAKAIAVSANGDRIYVAGTFIGKVSFGVKEIESFNNKADVFVQCFSADGQVQWADRIGSNVTDSDVGITTDKDGKLVMTGAFFGQTTFFSKQITANGEFFSDLYLSRIAKDGSIDFVKSWGGPYNDAGLAVTTDGHGAMYVTGYFDSSSTFGGSVITSAGGRDIFAARFFNNGDFEWIRTAGGIHDDEGRGIKVSKNGVPYVCGFFDTDAWFENIEVKGELTDPFLAALECGPDTRMQPQISELTICEGTDTTIVIRPGYPDYEWYVDGALFSSGNSNRINLDTLKMGEHKVYARVTDFYACSLNSDTVLVTVTEGLPKPVITRLGNDLSCDVQSVHYQWYVEGHPIDGATQSYVTILGDGLYRVLISNDSGCARWSDNYLVGTTAVDDNTTNIGIFPNPFSETLNVLGCEGAYISVYDLLGNVVLTIPQASAYEKMHIPGAAGTYIVKVLSSAKQYTQLVSKQ